MNFFLRFVTLFVLIFLGGCAAPKLMGKQILEPASRMENVVVVLNTDLYKSRTTFAAGQGAAYVDLLRQQIVEQFSQANVPAKVIEGDASLRTLKIRDSMNEAKPSHIVSVTSSGVTTVSNKAAKFVWTLGIHQIALSNVTGVSQVIEFNEDGKTSLRYRQVFSANFSADPCSSAIEASVRPKCVKDLTDLFLSTLKEGRFLQ